MCRVQLAIQISLTSLILMFSRKKQTRKQTRATKKLSICRVKFATQISSTSLTLMFSPNMINILQYVHYKSCRSKNVRIPVIYSQPLSVKGMLVLKENKTH